MAIKFQRGITCGNCHTGYQIDMGPEKKNLTTRRIKGELVYVPVCPNPECRHLEVSAAINPNRRSWYGKK